MNRWKKQLQTTLKSILNNHQNENVAHGKVVDYVFRFIPKARDPWRAIRKLYQEG